MKRVASKGYNPNAQTKIFHSTVKNVKANRFTRASIIPYTIINNIRYFCFFMDTNHHELCDGGGGIENGETFVSAAIRELKEESLGVFDLSSFEKNIIDSSKCYHTVKMIFIPVRLDFNLEDIERHQRKFRLQYVKEVDQLHAYQPPVSQILSPVLSPSRNDVDVIKDIGLGQLIVEKELEINGAEIDDVSYPENNFLFWISEVDLIQILNNDTTLSPMMTFPQIALMNKLNGDVKFNQFYRTNTNHGRPKIIDRYPKMWSITKMIINQIINTIE
jgi:hypothetical protein